MKNIYKDNANIQNDTENVNENRLDISVLGDDIVIFNSTYSGCG